MKRPPHPGRTREVDVREKAVRLRNLFVPALPLAAVLPGRLQRKLRDFTYVYNGEASKNRHKRTLKNMYDY